MAVAFDALATGGSEGLSGTSITDINSTSFGVGFTTACTINPAASATTLIILLSTDQTTDGTWTVTRGAQAASEIASSFFVSSSATQAVRAFEIKSPATGAGAIALKNSSYGTTEVQGYLTCMSFTGSDTSNASVAWGEAGTAAGSGGNFLMTTGASASSIPSGDMACAIFAELNQGVGSGGEGSTGGTGLTDIGVATAVNGNSCFSRISGNNNAITMTYSIGTSQPFAAVAVHVAVPGGGLTLGDGMPILFMRKMLGWRKHRRASRLLVPQWSF